MNTPESIIFLLLIALGFYYRGIIAILLAIALVSFFLGLL